VLPPEVEEAIAAIATDHRTGATTLCLRALDVFHRLAEQGADGAAVRAAAIELEKAQPAMASVRNVARMAVAFHDEGGAAGLGRYVAEMRADLRTVADRIARNFLKVLEEPVTVVTASHSSNVLACLAYAGRRRRLRHVYVLESRPLLEGRVLAQDLRRADIRCTLAADALGPTLCRRADLVLVGGDAILADGGVVNKIGSYGLALGAREAGIRFYAACETIKFDGQTSTDDWRLELLQDPTELVDDTNLPALNVYFEAVPPALLTGVVTERGTWTPSRLVQIMAMPR
jgi:translation initiation factor 2B subunit (eIF-2B alpha/beta/delta family)